MEVKLIFVFFFIGMFAIRADREYVVEEDFMKAVRKVADNKKLESKLDYKPVWVEIIIIIQLYII